MHGKQIEVYDATRRVRTTLAKVTMGISAVYDGSYFE